MKISRLARFNSLFAKVTALIAFSALVVGLTLNLLSLRATERMVVENLAGEVRTVGDYIADAIGGAIRFNNTDEIGKAARRAIEVSAGDISGVLVMNREGSVLLREGAVSDAMEAVGRQALESGVRASGPAELSVAVPSLSRDGAVVGVVALQANATASLARAHAPEIHVIAVSIGVLVLCLILAAWLVRRVIVHPLNDVRVAMRRISEKDYNVELATARRGDEIGAIARDVGEFRDRLARSDAQARTTLFQSTAFSGASIPMLMIDADRIIVAVNKAWDNLFQEHLDVFRKIWPDIDGQSFVGQSIDRFHKDPEHQKSLLSDLARMPFKSDILIDNLMMELSVQAITDENGAYAGNILEWRHVTAERLNGGVLGALKASASVTTFDLSGRILDVSEAVLDWSGLGRDELLAADMTVFADGGDTAMQDLWGRAKAGELVQSKVVRQGRDGASVWLDVTLAPVFDTHGKLFRIVELATDITAAETAARASAEQTRLVEDAQARVVADLGAGLAALARGDLTTELSHPFAPEYDRLRNDFNSAVEQLRAAIGQIVEVSVSILSGAGEITQASDDLARRTESQAATLQQTVAALDEITGSVRTTADDATDADSKVDDARSNASSGGAIVLEAVEAMKEIEDSSMQISKIISVIDDIAFQTNLLALNAGVEAARAGDAGRGFAVVASEVRALAQRSSDAAKQIKDLISTGDRHVKKGVELVGKSGDALQHIVESVDDISKLIASIARVSREQSTGLSEINVGVVQLDDVTQQNAAMVEQATAASHTMRSEAERLGDLVATFSTGRAAAHIGGRHSGHGPGQPAATPKPQAEPARAAASAAGPAQPRAADTSWEDF